MTKEEAKRAIYKAAKEDTSSPKDCIHLLSLHRFIEKIYNEHEAQLKAKDERIKELEQAMKPKTCSTCKYEILSGWMRGCEVQAWDVFTDGAYDSHIDDDFCCNRYEPKEK